MFDFEWHLIRERIENDRLKEELEAVYQEVHRQGTAVYHRGPILLALPMTPS